MTGSIATKLRKLDDVALHYISTVCKIPLESSRCYVTQNSRHTPTFTGTRIAHEN